MAAEPVVVWESRGVALGGHSDTLIVEKTGSHAPDSRRVYGIDSRKHLGEREAATVVEHLPTDVLAHLRQHTSAYVVVEQLPADVLARLREALAA